MFSGWYVAFVNLLSPSETAAFMNWIEVLENPGMPDEVIEATLAEIHEKVELNLRVYLLPSMIKLALSERACAETVLEEVRNICRQTKLQTAIQLGNVLTDKAKRDSWMGKWNPVVEEYSLDKDEYLNLVPHADKIAVMGTLCALQRQEICEIISADSWKEILRGMLSGVYGRYEMLLAWKVSGILGNELPVAFDSPLTGEERFFMKPDYVWAYLERYYADKNAAEILQDLRAHREDIPYRFLRKEKNAARAQDIDRCWLFYGREDEVQYSEYVDHLKMLWIAIIVNLAARKAADEGNVSQFAGRLCDEWKTERDGNNAGKGEEINLYTPWIRRATPLHKKSEKDRYAEYPTMSREIETVKAGLYMPTISLLVTHLEDKLPEFLCELELNLCDAFSNAYLLKILRENTKGEISRAALGLIAFVRNSTEYFGKGYLNSRAPQRLFELLEKKSVFISGNEPQTMPEQEVNLYSGASLLSCAQLAYEEASGQMFSQDSEMLWTYGDGDSLAEKICRLILTDYWKFLDRKGNPNRYPDVWMNTQISLVYEHYPEILSEIRPKVRDWLGNARNNGVFRQSAMLLRKYTRDDWDTLELQLPERTKSNYRFMLGALTHYVASILRDGAELGENDRKRIDEWLDAVIRIYEKKEFSRIFRFLCIEMVDLFLADETVVHMAEMNGSAMDFEKAEPVKDVRDAVQILIEAIIEFSSEAVYYQYMLGDVLLKHVQTKHYNLIAFLIKDYLYMLLGQYYERQYYDKTIQGNDYQTVYKWKEIEGAAKARKQLLYWVIAKIQNTLLDDLNFRYDLQDMLEKHHKKDRRNRKLQIEIEPGRIFLSGAKEPETTIADEKKWNPYWDADTLSAAGRRERSLGIEGMARQEEDGWKPVERDFLSLLIEQAEALKSQEGIRLTLIENDGYGLLVSACPGRNYYLPAECWNTPIVEELTRQESEYQEEQGKTLYGLILIACLEIDGDGLPVLRLIDKDERNLVYADLFNESESISLSDEEQESGRICRNGFEIDIDGHCCAYMKLAVNGWNVIAQRKCKVRLRKDESLRQIETGKETKEAVLKRLLEWNKNSVVTLRNVSTDGFGNWQMLNGMTNENVPVRVFPESVSMDPAGISRHISNVRAVISGQMSTYRDVQANGIVWECGAGKQITFMYLDENGYIREQVVESRSFYSGRIKVYPGLPVHVNRSTNEIRLVQRLSGNQQPRFRTVRVLWQVEKVAEDSKRIAACVCLGEYTLPGETEESVLYQDYRNMCLLAVPKGGVPADNGMICGLDLGKGLAVQLFDWDETDRIQFRVQDRNCYGEAEKGMFHRKPVHCGRVSIQLIPYEVNGKIYYDIHRFFSEPQVTMRKELRQEESKSYEIRARERALKAYENWINDSEWNIKGRLHAEGIIVRQADEVCFEFRKPVGYVPVHPGAADQIETGEWTRRIPLMPYEDSNHEMNNGDIVYACIVHENDSDTYAARTDLAIHFTLERFQQWMTRRYPGVKAYWEQPLFYVKRTDDHHLFTWGHGFYLELPESELRLEGTEKASVSQILFHGDKIRKYRIIRTDGQLCLSFFMDDYEFEVEHQIAIDSASHMLHSLSVEYKKEQNTVRTLRISLSEKGLGYKDDAWYYASYSKGVLGERTEKQVRTLLPNGGTGYLLVSSRWDEEKNRYTFEHINLNEIKDQMILCLKGGEIQATRSGNDFYVPFSFPFASDAALYPDERFFEVRVKRRVFSYNEGVLRAYYVGGKRDAFERMMLVRIIRNGDGRFDGQIKTLPVRSEKSIRSWIGKEGPQQVVVGDETGNGTVRVEIKPGVFCEAVPDKEPGVGATGRLFLLDDAVLVEPVTESDWQFIPKTGAPRLVELLIMDSVFHRTGKAVNRHFTVAGLPHIMLRNELLAGQLMKEYPPRFGMVSMDENGEAHVVPAISKVYGYLSARQDGNGKEIRVEDANHEVVTIWHPAQLSFLDGSVDDLWSFILHASWHYHDLRTSVLRENGKEEIYEYGHGNALPVLFSGGCRLRYTKDEIDRFVYPPHELEEYGVETVGGMAREYPVAGNEHQNLLIELSPGRIVRVPYQMIQCALDKQSAGHVCLDDVWIGDMLSLSTRETEPGKPLMLVLHGVRYGIRGAINKQAYLPVSGYRSDVGALILGEGRATIATPVTECEWHEGQMVRLYEDNTLVEATVPEAGDMVLVKLNEDGQLTVAGDAQFEIVVAVNGTQSWYEGDFWLKKCLKEVPAEMKHLCGLDILPMIVENVSIGKRWKKLIVSYPQPMSPAAGIVLPGQIVGQAEGHFLVARSGAYLFRVNMSEMLKVKPELSDDILSELFRSEKIAVGMQMWFTCTGKNTFRIGIHKKDRQWKNVEIVTAVDSVNGEGFICLEKESRAYLWMPVKNIARTEGFRAGEILPLLREYSGESCSLAIMVDERGHGSFKMGRDYLENNFMKLRQNDRESTVQVIVASQGKPDGHKNLYLCHEKPRGNIYTLQAELERIKGQIIDAVCIRKTADTAMLIPRDEFRTALNLSPFLLRTVHDSYRNDQIQIEEVRKSYNRSCEEDLLEALHKSVISLVNALQNGVSRNDDAFKTEVEQGKEIVEANYTVFFQNERQTVSLRNAFSFILMTYQWDKHTAEKLYAGLIKDAGRLCCEELLLREWFLSDAVYGRHDMRKLLEMMDWSGRELGTNKRNSSFTGKLTIDQTIRTDAICKTILRRYQQDDQLPFMRLASNILFSMGEINASEVQDTWAECSCRILRENYTVEKLLKASELVQFLRRLEEPVFAHLEVSGKRFDNSLISRRT